MALISIRTAVLLAVFIGVISVLDQYKHHMYVFEPQKLQAIAQRNIAKNHSSAHALFLDLVKDLAKYALSRI